MGRMGAILASAACVLGAAAGPSDELASGEVRAAEPRSHSLPLGPAEYVRLVVRREAADVAVRVRSPEGRVLVETDTLAFPPGPRELPLLAETAGAYRIEVSLLPGAEASRYRIDVLERRRTAPADAPRVQAEVDYLVAESLRVKGTSESLARAQAGYEEALALARGVGEAVVEADALTGLARVREVRGDRGQALREYGEALSRHRALGRTRAVSNVLGFIAVVLDHLGDRTEARKAAEEALATAREGGDRRAEGIAFNNLGLVALHTGDKQAALGFFEEALEAAREAGNPRGEGVTLGNIGTTHDTMGDRERALEYLHRSLLVRRAVGDPRDVAVALNNIGAVHRSVDELPQAADFYRRALEAWRQGADQSGEAATLHNLAQLHQIGGEYQEALELYQRSLLLLRATKSPVREANALTSVGRIHQILGDGRRALGSYEEALRLHRAAGNRAFEATTLFQMGELESERGDHTRARMLFEEALALQREVKDRRGEAASLRGLGGAQAALGAPEEALGTLMQALDLYREVQSPRGEAGTLLTIASVEAAGGALDKALTRAEEARALFRQLSDRRGEASALVALARLESEQGGLESARRLVEEGLGLVEELRSQIGANELRSSFLATAQDDYALYVDVLMRLHARHPGSGFDALALQASERARARSLLDLLGEARSWIGEDADPELREREKRLRQALSAKAARQSRLLAGAEGAPEAAALGRELENLLDELRLVQAQIRTRSPRYAALTQPQPLSLDEVRREVLDADTLLLEYALGEPRSYLWAVGPDSLESWELPARSVLEAAARRLYGRLSRPPVAGEDPTEEAVALGRLLLSPVAGRLRARRLVVVADGALQTVPFAALGDPASGRPLVEDHEVVSLPSASTLAMLRRHRPDTRAERTLAVLADPVFDARDPRVRARARARTVAADLPAAVRGGLARLIGSRREAAAILGLVPPREAWAALDFQASRKSALRPDLGRYRIVHFATHGVLDAQRPELSGIVLSLVDEQGKPQDGFLRLHEVYNLRLGAELVVLSACQTALGQPVPGEGLVGLVRGFMHAGAPAVLATLWKVDDRATTELMRRFYAELLGPRKPSPGAALRTAQVAVARKTRWRSPYYWAGFVLQGEWR